MGTIPSTAAEISLHVVLYLPAQVPLGTSVDDKLSGIGLIQLWVKDMG